MNFFNFLTRPTGQIEEEASMPITEKTMDVPCQEDGRCHHKRPNLCNDLALTFGATGFRKEGDFLKSTGNTIVGYAVDEALIREVKIAWGNELSVSETIGILVNGEVVEEIVLDETDGNSKCVRVHEYVCECDVIQVQSLEGKARACEITVSVWLEPKCYKHFKHEGDGLFEAYLAETGTIPIPTIFSPVSMGEIRVNTLPGYISYDGTEVTLEQGVYKVDYAIGITTQTSTALDFEAHLLVDGTDYPSSKSAQHILAGQGGDVSLAQGVTIVVPRGDTRTIVLEAKTSIDSSTSGTADANIIVERVANSIDL